MEENAANCLRVEGLGKRFGDIWALRECSLQVPTGVVFGLLGPNGAGKTTLIRSILGFLRPTVGSMHVFGLDCHHQSVQVRREVAYLPAEAKMFRSFRGDQVIRFFAAMHPRGDLARALEIADRLQLATRRRVAFMSTGMRQKLAIACTLSCQAPLVILDEPTANLDPTVRREVIGLVQQAKQEGRTIIFSSHVLSEIEEACQLAAIMREGRVVHEVDLEHLKARHRIVGRWRGSFPFEKVSLPEQVAAIESSPDRITMEVAGPLEGHLAWLSQLPIDQMKMESASLRSLYESHQDSAGS